MELLPVWYDTRLFAGLVAIGFIVVIAWRASMTRRAAPVAFGLLWFCMALTPASSIIPLSEVANEHRIFFPYLGLALAVVWGTRLWAGRWVAAWPRAGLLTVCLVAFAVLTAHAAGTYQRNTVWASDETLWADVVEKSPRNGRAWMNYGLSQMSRGRFGRAKQLFEQAEVYNPNYAILETNLAIVTDRLGDAATAEGHFLRSLALAPNYEGGLYFYAQWLVRQGRADEAVPHLRRALELSPAYALPRTVLMNLFYVQRADADLEQLARDTLAIFPDDPAAGAYVDGRTPVTGADGGTQSHYDRGLALTQQSRHLEAAVAYRHALEDEPDSPNVLNNYGWTVDTLGFHEAAMEPLERALAVNPDFTRAANNLAVARRNLEGG